MTGIFEQCIERNMKKYTTKISNDQIISSQLLYLIWDILVKYTYQQLNANRYIYIPKLGTIG